MIQRIVAGTLAVAVVVLTGCGNGTGATGSPVSPPSSAPADPGGLPTVDRTAKPPREPTDNLPSSGWVAGMVTRGGSGPCYGLITDDGIGYALYSADGITLAKGARVRVRIQRTMLRIHCGPGRLVAMTAAEPIR